MSDMRQLAALESSQVLGVQGRVRLMRDGLINNVGYVVSGLVGILLVPIMLRGLGAELYGLWIAALAVGGIVGILDFGLGWSLTREVAGSPSGEGIEQTARFVTSAGNAYLLLGIVGGGLISALGFPMSGGLHLSPESQKIAPAVFVLAGFTFFANQIHLFTSHVLNGLRRFDAANLLAAGTMILQAVGVVALLKAGASLVPVAAWSFVVAASTGLVALEVVGRLNPGYRLRMGRLDWTALRAKLSFGITSLLAEGACWVGWHSAPILIAVMLGSASVVPYHIGQKFPLAVLGISWRASEVLFVRASQRGKDLAAAREVVEAGTRWIVVLVLPLCLVLWTVAPSLLRLWIGNAIGDSVVVLRLTCGAVLADAVGRGALEAAWGRGTMLTVLGIMGSAAIAILGLSAWLLPRMGVSGAAWALFLVIIAGSLMVLYLESRTCGIKISCVLGAAFRGLWLPVIACFATALGIEQFASPDGWPKLATVMLMACVAYVLTLYLGAARGEEKMLAREILRLPVNLARFPYRIVRRRLGR